VLEFCEKSKVKWGTCSLQRNNILMIKGKVMEAIVKYIFIGKQKVVLCPELRENQREAAASALTIHFSFMVKFVNYISFGSNGCLWSAQP
jgi:hypothetical protein